MNESNVQNFKNVLLKARISDNRYPVQGCHIWLPYGYQLKENIFRVIEEYVEGDGYQKYQFPRLIPGSAMKPVTANIADFEESLFWLRKKDGEEIDVFLSPTGECAVYTMFKKWINQEHDLPLKIYQRSSIFRLHRNPVAMLNGDERMDLVELHSAFRSQEKANEEFAKTTGTFRKLIEKAGIPYLPLERPVWGNKPVFTEMVSLETYLPSKRRAFNVAVIYNQGQIFSKPFGVEYSDREGKRRNTYQITAGISERIVTAMLDIHRDETGLRLLPEFAPEQMTIVPIYTGEGNEDVMRYAKELGKQLGDLYRVNVDTGRENIHPGKKIAASRTRGVPIQIGVNYADIERRTARVYVRTRYPPINELPTEKLIESVPTFLDEVDQTIRKESRNYLTLQIGTAQSTDDMRAIIEENRIAKFSFCGKTSCIEDLDKELEGELIGLHIDEKTDGPCPSCSKKATHIGFYSKRSDSP